MYIFQFFTRRGWVIGAPRICYSEIVSIVKEQEQ